MLINSLFFLISNFLLLFLSINIDKWLLKFHVKKLFESFSRVFFEHRWIMFEDLKNFSFIIIFSDEAVIYLACHIIIFLFKKILHNSKRIAFCVTENSSPADAIFWNGNPASKRASLGRYIHMDLNYLSFILFVCILWKGCTSYA